MSVSYRTWVIGVIVSVLAIGVVLSRCSSESEESSQARTYLVTLRVTGDADKAGITYDYEGTDGVREDVSVPWKKSVTQNAGDSVSLTAVAIDDGYVEVSISVDGTKVASDSSKGFGGGVWCSHYVP